MKKDNKFSSLNTINEVKENTFIFEKQNALLVLFAMT